MAKHASYDEKNVAHQTDLQILAGKIKDIKVVMLTTLDPDGVLRSRPMGAQSMQFDGQLWFFTQADSGKVHAIENNQQVNLGYSDNEKNVWVSVSGYARIVRDKKKMEELWSPILKAWFSKGLEDPNLGLICVDVDSAQYWDSPSGPLVVLSAFMKKALTGRTLDQSEYTQKLDLKH